MYRNHMGVAHSPCTGKLTGSLLFSVSSKSKTTDDEITCIRCYIEKTVAIEDHDCLEPPLFS